MSSNHEDDIGAVGGGDRPCPVCRNCSNLGVNLRDENSLRVECDWESNESRCRSWLERCTIGTSDGESVISSEASGTSGTTNSASLQDDEDNDFEYGDVDYKNKVVCVRDDPNSKALQNVFNTANQYGTVNMENCRSVHLGNVTNLYGEIRIIQNTATVNTQNITNQIFLEGAAVPLRSGRLSIIDRKSWLAQPPLEKEFLAAPAKFVIISHTATEDGTTQAENVYLVRLVQTFHVESRKWSDIGYNFLIGSDGNVYEGRGWGVVGAHTHGYNPIGMGISFVGCYMNKLPPQVALDQAKLLIQQGVAQGYLVPDYFLVGHCQCSPTESPGKTLYEEIRKWDNWNPLITLDSPAP